uniref:Putative secreted protein n=1 Tax=Rhipicephalus microplus TaxID=6941 RepID=A0A6G5A128_RHIMP
MNSIMFVQWLIPVYKLLFIVWITHTLGHTLHNVRLVVVLYSSQPTKTLLHNGYHDHMQVVNTCGINAYRKTSDGTYKKRRHLYCYTLLNKDASYALWTTIH